MFNLTKIWSYVTPKMKLILVLMQGLYAVLVVFALGFAVYVNGFGHLLTLVNDGRMASIIGLYLIWPTIPMLLMVWLEGYSNCKQAKENPKTLEA